MIAMLKKLAIVLSSYSIVRLQYIRGKFYQSFRILDGTIQPN